MCEIPPWRVCSQPPVHVVKLILFFSPVGCGGSNYRQDKELGVRMAAGRIAISSSLL